MIDDESIVRMEHTNQEAIRPRRDPKVYRLPHRTSGADAVSRQSLRLEALSRALRNVSSGSRAIFDADFDALYPPSIRAVSTSFWTPVAVALRAAELLVSRRRTRILDVGSGVGKFCIVGALATGASFTGFEHRQHFVDISEDVARRLGAASARFVHGRLDQIEPANFDAFYFYNPFEENMWGADIQLDQTVELSESRYFADLDIALAMLRNAPVGTHVATFHGIGGPMPAAYRRLMREPFGSGELELWVKTRFQLNGR